MSNIKKLVTGITAVVVSVSSALGASALEWKVKGYDTTVLEKEAYNTYRVGVIYEQFDDNNLSTGVVVDSKLAEVYGLEPYARVSFSAPAFERAWPNREYVAVYANGDITGKVLYTGVKENLKYRDANYMWELAAPHRIYSRKQALIYGNWYTDASYPTQYAGDVATVTAEYSNFYGFGMWRVNGSAISYMPAALRSYANVDTDIYFDGGVAGNALAPDTVTDLTGKKDIQIKKTFNLVLSGPKFNFDGTVTKGNEFAAVYSAADAEPETLANFAVAELVKHVYSHDGSCATMDVEWVNAGFESAAPYRYYQFLKVGDVLLDGRLIEGTTMNRPKVYRYIIGPDGNPATANVTAVYTTALSASKPYRWNDQVGKYEFLVDTTETLYYNGVAFKRLITKEQPSNVFGQLNYSEKWVNGQKIVSAVLEGQALNGEIYRADFRGSVYNDIGWGNENFNNINAGLDYNYQYIDGITVPAVD
ncbi:MAG: hypothetical protein ACI4RV_08575 [Eubacteriales bacterium]